MNGFCVACGIDGDDLLTANLFGTHELKDGPSGMPEGMISAEEFTNTVGLTIRSMRVGNRWGIKTLPVEVSALEVFYSEEMDGSFTELSSSDNLFDSPDKVDNQVEDDDFFVDLDDDDDEEEEKIDIYNDEELIDYALAQRGRRSSSALSARGLRTSAHRKWIERPCRRRAE